MCGEGVEAKSTWEADVGVEALSRDIIAPGYIRIRPSWISWVEAIAGCVCGCVSERPDHPRYIHE